MENPRIIKSRLDNRFLLKALRFRKFSIPRAQEYIERYLIYKSGFYGYDWFSNLDPLRPNLIDLMEKGLKKFSRKLFLEKFNFRSGDSTSQT